MNKLIEQIFNNFRVNGVLIPVKFLVYQGDSTTYITYQSTDIDETLYGDDDLQNYVEYYDFDIYSKGNYFPIVDAVKELLQANGFRWQPTRSSGDLYDTDTKMYHKTLCFSIERSENNG